MVGAWWELLEPWDLSSEPSALSITPGTRLKTPVRDAPFVVDGCRLSGRRAAPRPRAAGDAALLGVPGGRRALPQGPAVGEGGVHINSMRLFGLDYDVRTETPFVYLCDTHLAAVRGQPT